MKERPILFSAQMVRALLDGSKTQTRRVVSAKHLQWIENSILNFLDGKWNQRPLPYGLPGDRLWVREAWRVIDVADCFAPREITAASRIWYEADAPHQPGFGRYRPPMFMPRWASRITLEITGVRVERLHDISKEDARAEGITDGGCLNCGNSETDCGCLNPQPDARDSFIRLWQSINGPDSWSANPWVWVVEFKRTEGGAA
jgi:hypothetical protein